MGNSTGTMRRESKEKRKLNLQGLDAGRSRQQISDDLEEFTATSHLPSRWAINSSARTEVFSENVTISIHSVGTSDIIMRLRALAMLTSVSVSSKHILSSTSSVTFTLGVLLLGMFFFLCWPFFGDDCYQLALSPLLSSNSFH